jgi:hypothetical protein
MFILFIILASKVNLMTHYTKGMLLQNLFNCYRSTLNITV